MEGLQWAMKRTVDLSIPIPKEIVAAITQYLPATNYVRSIQGLQSLDFEIRSSVIYVITFTKFIEFG